MHPSSDPHDFDYRLVAELSGDLLIMHQNFNKFYVNPAVEKILGYSQNEYLALNPIEILHPAYHEKFKESLEKQKNTGDGFESIEEFELRHKLGHYIHLSSHIIVKRANDGHLYTIINARDISDEKKVNAELLKLSGIVEQSPVSIIITDTEGLIEYANPAFTEVLGYLPKEVIGKKPNIFKTDYHPQVYYHTLWSTIRAGHQWNGIFRNRKKDGTHIWEEATIAPLFNEKREIINYVAIKQNVTDRINAERALQESEERWKFALEGSKDGVWDWNLVTNEVYFSPQWKAMLGYSEDEITASLDEWSRRVHPDDLEQCYKDINRHLTGEMSFYKNIHRVLCKDGSYKWILDRGKITSYTPEGKPWRMIGTHTDMTERIEMERQLVQLNADKDRFLSIMAHDLRNPMSAISGLAGVILDQLASYSKDQIEPMLRVLATTSEQTYKLLEDLLLWSKSQSGKVKFEPLSFSLRTLVAEVTESIGSLWRNKGIEITYTEDDDTPVVADIFMLKTILRNLISNAIKFSYEGSNIIISKESKTDQTMLTVADQGVGIEPADLSKLWDITQPFTTVGTNKEKGSGFGLLICKDFVEKHRGTIHAESSPGQGTRFIISLPLGKPGGILE